jgi:RHS repeat-associated protein
VAFTDDDLGYGWRLKGLSRIHRCRLGLSGASPPNLDSTDTLCLDGQLLKVVSGTYWADNSVYRTESQSFVRVTRMAGDWFEARYPDGRIVRYGDTATSRVLGSGRFGGGTFMWSQPNPTFVWGERHVTNGFGDVYTVDYEVVDAYGLIQPKVISYAGATVEFKYGPRTDTGTVYFQIAGSLGYIKRPSVLHTVRVKLNGTSVREYRLDSNLVSGRMQLEKVQECGYTASGTGPACLKPLQLAWTAVTGGAQNFPIAVSSLTDGLGARTEYFYSTITTASNPLTYTEAPFGAIQAAPETTAQDVAAVNEMRRSDGLTDTGRRRWTYRYKSLAYKNSLNRGYIGIYEVREKDEQSGIHVYSQVRLDPSFRGVVSQVRAFTAAFGSGQELAREERAYATKPQTGGVVLPYPTRVTRWQFENGVVVGGSEDTHTLCFRTLSGDTCPGTGTEGEFITQTSTSTLTGSTVSNPTFSPGFWGDVPDRAITGTELTTTTTVNLQNGTSPWVVGAPIKTIVTDTAAGESAKTVTHTFSYRSGTRELLTRNRLPGDAALNLVHTRTFTGSHPTSVATTGSGIASRTVSFGTPYVQSRYPASVTNAAGHTTTLAYDLRFGQVSQATDPDSNVTSLEYDGFGRVVRTTTQDGTDREVSYERCDVVGCPAVAGAVAAVKVTTTAANGSVQVAPTRAEYLDVLGRTVLTEVEALDSGDGWHRQRAVYNNRALVQYVSRPYFSTQTTPTCAGAGANCTWFTYDIRDRVTREDRPDLGFTTTAYAGAAGSVTVTTTETVKTPGLADVTRAKRTVFNVLGQLTQTIDAYGTGSAVTSTYDYDSHGNLDYVSVGGVQMATMSYDMAGRRTALNDANTGNWTFTYDTLGSLTRTVDARAQDTRYTYDLLGRLTQRVDLYGTGSAATHTWTWDGVYGTGQLASRSSPGLTETYSYRAADSKLESAVTAISVSGVHSGNYTRSFGYDAQGRLSTLGYPSGSTFSHAYNARGYLTQVKSGSTVLEHVQDTDPFGNPTVTGFANGLTTLRGYDPATGRLTAIHTGTAGVPKSVQDLEYQWRTNSSLYRRFDRRNTTATGDDYTDTFSYDALERVTAQATSVGASRTLTFAYSSWGNLTSKTSSVGGDLNVTGYTYGTTGKPHRLTAVTLAGVANTLAYDSNGNLTTYDAASGNDTFLTYDGQNRVTRITVGVSSGTTTPAARDEFWYDGDGERFLGRESWDDAGVQRQARTVYLGAFEEVIPAAGSPYNLVQRTDLSASVRHVRTRTTGGVITARFEYLHRDHLGSVDVVTSAAGAILNDKLSFDAFGGRRSAAWNSDITAPALTTILHYEDERFARGYTDHEMLSRTGFVHMNGRVYDPRIGRFVSPDPIVQAPAFSQSYNRYAYVFNSPLSYTDPSGYQGVHEGRAERPGGSGPAGDGFPSPPIGPTCDEIAPADLCYLGFERWSQRIQSVLGDIEEPGDLVADRSNVPAAANDDIRCDFSGPLECEALDTGGVGDGPRTNPLFIEIDVKYGEYRCTTSGSSICRFVGPGRSSDNLFGVDEVLEDHCTPYGCSYRSKQTIRSFRVDPRSWWDRWIFGPEFFESLEKQPATCAESELCEN